MSMLLWLFNVRARSEVRLRIANLHIKGFRNFVDESIDFDEKTLIIGGNDTGKSNLLYAIRILLDPGLSSRDLELSPSDFCIYSDSDCIEITARLEDVVEDCAISALHGAAEDGASVIRFFLRRNGEYEILTGPSEDMLEPRNGRTYLKNLAVEYVGSGRDLSAFIRRQQNRLLDIARNQRTENQEAEDANSVECIQKDLLDLNDAISSLHYVRDSLAAVNSEMGAISIGNEGYTARLVAGNTDANKMLDNLQLAYLYGDSPLVFGGDGRGNQLYFATWMSEQRLNKRPERAIFYAIEEPEAHLHPHQQRRLAEYLSSSIDGQVIITTHSPQIVERFGDGKILRLAFDNGNAQASHAHGCSAEVDDALSRMGYRLNAISSETFFSSGVLLVEGPSERMLYTALARSLYEDADRLNVSILSVDGVGFEPYVRVCIGLGIPYVIRTDNDIFPVGKTDMRRMAGLQRLLDIVKSHVKDEGLNQLIFSCESALSWSGSDELPSSAEQARDLLVPELEKHGLYLSKEADLETDLACGPLADQLKEFFEAATPHEVVKTMQRRKAENMHSFIASDPCLCDLANDPVATPLDHIVGLAEGRRS